MYHTLTSNFRYPDYLRLRKEFPVFTYQSYTITRNPDEITIVFHFHLSGRYHFYPAIQFPMRSFYHSDLPEPLLHNLAFHIGMVELISYWKLSCAPVVEIIPFDLSEVQKQWWKKLYFHGLGEFFYVNGIQSSIDDFMDIHTKGSSLPVKQHQAITDHCLVPVGGGKDSAVSLELLKQYGFPFRPLIVNPRPASTACAQIAGYSPEESILVVRSLDPLMLQLNDQGFLNGHTPFSALLAFISAFAAVLTHASFIVLSNESSANEASVPNTDINHQYSKSVIFRKDFRLYLNTYIVSGIEYFSLLRPLNELQIAHLFSKYSSFHPVFKSCNIGSKTNSWCGNCSKCLFTWLMLSPFLSQPELHQIFGQNLADNTQLTPVLASLKGDTPNKPFECVGTIEEVNIAIQMIVLQGIPGDLFVEFRNTQYDQTKVKQQFQALLTRFDTDHCLPQQFEWLIRKALNDRKNF